MNKRTTSQASAHLPPVRPLAKRPAKRLTSGEVVATGTSAAGKASRSKGLAVKVTTLRLSRPLHQQLELLQSLLHVPVNKLINLAVGDFVARRTAEVAADMTNVLERIRQAREADPDYEQAIADFVEAEATYAKDDPVEGKPKEARARRPQSLVQRMLARG